MTLLETPALDSPSVATARRRRRTSLVTPAALLVAGTVVLAVRVLVVGKGFPLWGDYVPVSRGALPQLVGPWSTVQHGGSINAGINQEGWLAPLAWLDGSPGSVGYDLVAKLFVTASALAPFVVAMWSARGRGLHRFLVALPPAAVFAFNPWCLAQEGSGHYSLILGYSLLPACWRLARRTDFDSARIRGVVLASALWLTASFDLHMAIAAGIVIGVGIAERSRRLLPVVGATAAALVPLTAYWWLPTLLTTHSIDGGSSFASTSGVSVADISKLAALGDVYHVLGDRAFWWTTFSDGWYGRIAAGTIVCTILLLLLAAGRFSYRIWLLLGLGTVPVAAAHYLPALYAEMVRLPGLGLFIDPSYWEAFYSLGIWAALTATFPTPHIEGMSAPRILRQLVICSLVAALAVPFATNRVHDIFKMSSVDDGQLRTTTWLNQQHLGEVLWLPVVPYLQTSWSDGLVNDPERIWSTGKIANSYSESYYSTDPNYDQELLDLQNLLLGAPQDGATPYLISRALVPALRVAGIDAVVLRSDAFPPQSAQVLKSTFGSLLPVGYKSGMTTVYLVPAAHSSASRAPGPTLVPTGWAGLMSAIAAGSASGAYIENEQAGTTALLADSRTSVVASNTWTMLFGLGQSSVPAALRRDAPSDDFGASTGYEMPAGKTFTFPSQGVAALAVVGDDSSIHLSCSGSTPGGVDYAPALKSITNSDLLAEGEPAVTRHWLAIACDGQVQVRLSAAAWVVGARSMSVPEYKYRVKEMLAATTRPGSGYVLNGGELVLSAGGLFSEYHNPLLVGTGEYRLRAEGSGCTVDTASFTMQGGGATTTVPVEGNTTTVRLDAGFYQVELRGRDPKDCSMVAVLSARDTPLAVTPAVQPPSARASRSYPGPSGLVVFGPPGPWTVTAAAKVVVGMSANALGTWYRGSPSGLRSAPGPIRWSWVGPLISLAAVLWLAVEWFLWRRRRGHAGD